MSKIFSIGASGAILLSLLLLSSCTYSDPRAEKVKEERAAEVADHSRLRAAGKPIAYKYCDFFLANRLGLHRFEIEDFSNLSNKTIKYLEISVRLYNRVGDKVTSSIKRKHIISMTATGPYIPVAQKTYSTEYEWSKGEYIYCEPCYCDQPLGACKYNGVIRYMDGTSKSFTHEEFLSWKR